MVIINSLTSTLSPFSSTFLASATSSTHSSSSSSFSTLLSSAIMFLSWKSSIGTSSQSSAF